MSILNEAFFEPLNEPYQSYPVPQYYFANEVAEQAPPAMRAGLPDLTWQPPREGTRVPLA